MSRWGELIPHDEDNDNCLCGCLDESSDEVPSEEEERQVPELDTLREAVQGSDGA